MGQLMMDFPLDPHCASFPFKNSENFLKISDGVQIVSSPQTPCSRNSAKLQDQQSWPVSVLEPSPASLKGHLMVNQNLRYQNT